jgi:hypothetical protein
MSISGSESALSLVRGRTVFTTGRIVFIKPYYAKGRGGEAERKGYKLTIDPKLVVKLQGERYSVLVSAFGKSSAWHSYRMLKRSGALVSVSGRRAASKVYDDPSSEAGKAVWVILERDPPPHLAVVED